MKSPVVEVKGLTRYFGSKAAVTDVSFGVGEGEVFALLGPNGAGKTTIMRMLLGLLEPTRGQAALFGCPSQALTPAIRARIGYLAEGHCLYGWMRIKHLAAFTAGTHPRWNGRQFGDFMDYFHLSPKERIGSLSNGQRAQVSLSLALACDPELLVMDDPTLGLDTGTRHEFLRGIIDLVSREGRTVIFSSHILPDVERIASRVAILIGSVLRADVPLEDFKTGMARYHLAFAGEVPSLQGIPRLVNRTIMEHEALVTLVRPGPDTEEALKRTGASACERVDLSLEDAFVDYTSGGERRLTFGANVG
ncbi:MAG: ABC transporter ATP-binding protein [Planctomycetota bacterium]|nr:ABC transporter ATP-binding protein [Planctomycetota bacterium]